MTTTAPQTGHKDPSRDALRVAQMCSGQGPRGGSLHRSWLVSAKLQMGWFSEELGLSTPLFWAWLGLGISTTLDSEREGLGLEASGTTPTQPASQP